jgi:hypothetical protein
MVRGPHGGRRRGARGRGTTPPLESMPEGSNPKEKKNSLGRSILLWGMWLV